MAAVNFYEEFLLQDGANAAGNGEAFITQGLACALIQVDGITTATVTFESLVDGANWDSLQVLNVSTGEVSSTTESDGTFVANMAGAKRIRARISSWTAGTITVTAIGTTSPPAAWPTQGGRAGQVLDVTLSLDTSGAYSSGDVLADTQTLASAVRSAGGRVELQSVTVLDEDDQAQAFDLVFLDTNNSLGTENSAVSISDANARQFLGVVSVAAADYVDLGGCQLATKRGLALDLKAASGSTSLYVGAISRGTGTYSASGLKLKLGLRYL